MNYNNCDIRLRKTSEPAREVKPRTAKPHRKPAVTKLGSKATGRSVE